jgi:hypothetical protein
MSARISTIHDVHDNEFSLSGGLEVLTSIFNKKPYYLKQMASFEMIFS